MVISKKENVMMKYAYNREKIIIIPESGQTPFYTYSKQSRSSTKPNRRTANMNSIQCKKWLFSFHIHQCIVIFLYIDFGLIFIANNLSDDQDNNHNRARDENDNRNNHYNEINQEHIEFHQTYMVLSAAP